MSKYRVKIDPSYHQPIVTAKYVLHLVESFLGMNYDPEEWEEKVRFPRERRIILYALREAAYQPSPDRRDQLIQLCRKFMTHQPRYWPRFLRERYQYAVTRDFFSVPWADISAEFLEYDQEMHELGADPAGTGRVFDAAPPWADLKSQISKLTDQMTVRRKT